jgi:Cu+-exporting ATPase
MADVPTLSAQKAIKHFQKFGLKVAMVVVGNLGTARGIARQLGIGQCLDEVLHGSKTEEIRKLQRSGEVVAMAGDGINDAPALAAADIGIAVGMDVVIEASDITLMREDLLSVPQAIILSETTMRLIKQDLCGAFFITSSAFLLQQVFYILLPEFYLIPNMPLQQWH